MDIWIPVDNVSEVFRILEELKQSGYIMNKDFSWAYHSACWDNFGGSTSPRGVVFTFMTDSLASWFGLKYGTKV